MPGRLSIAARIPKCRRAAGSGANNRKSRECLPSGRLQELRQSAELHESVVRCAASVARRSSAAMAPAAAIAPALVPRCGESDIVWTAIQLRPQDDARRYPSLHHQVAETASCVGRVGRRRFIVGPFLRASVGAACSPQASGRAVPADAVCSKPLNITGDRIPGIAVPDPPLQPRG
jgi:hypothetical protein